MGTDLWLPESLRREGQVEGQLALARYWNEAVKRIDPQLSLVLARDTAEPPLLPGRWHVRRSNRGVPDSYLPITGPNGEYREPDHGILDELHRRDTWIDGGLNKFLEQKHAPEQEAQKERELRAEQRRDEFAADFRAARRMPGEDVERKSKRRRSA